jgi:hypothetical protein
LEGVCFPGKQKRSFEGNDQQGSGHFVRNFQQGSRHSDGTPFPKKQGTYKRLHKVWKPKLRHPKLILGMDVGLSEACNLALCALVGRLAYKEKCKQNIDDWIANNWKPLLGYLPKIHLLQHGWFGFIFKKPEDTALILGSFWAFDGGSLMLKRWRLGFNPSTEFFSHRHIWVLLPGLPLQLWNQQALELIGASLGRFLRVDINSLAAPDRRMARIYVEIDIQAGLPEILEIDWRSQLIAQRLDYLGIPFRCSLCRRTGHLRRDCSKFSPPETVSDPAEETNFDGYISPPDQLAEEAPFPRRDFNPPEDTLVGKIHQHCPSLFNTFSAWDRLFINEQADKILFSEPYGFSSC